MENSSKDSLYYLEFVGQSANQTADGYSPISIYQFIDSSYTNRTTSQFYISDSVVVSYGDSASLVDTRMVVLADTLKKGMRWIAADTYRTTDSVIVKIDAVVNEYYPNIRVRDSVYDNVFRVEYTISARTLESRFAEYRTGARYVWYFAEGVGVVLQYVYGASGESLWKNELIEQRIK